MYIMYIDNKDNKGDKMTIGTKIKKETVKFSVHIPGGIDVIAEGKTSKEAIQNWLNIVTNENYEFDKIVFTRI